MYRKVVALILGNPLTLHIYVGCRYNESTYGKLIKIALNDM